MLGQFFVHKLKILNILLTKTEIKKDEFDQEN